MVTGNQFNRLVADSTQDIILVTWEHSGVEENLSLYGDVTYDGKAFSGGGLLSLKRTGQTGATIVMPTNTDRLLEVYGGAWRGGKICKIYQIPAAPGMAVSYVEADAFLVLDGVIDASSHKGGRVTVRAVHKSLSGKYTPAHNCSQFSQRIPSSGTIIGGSDDQYALEGRRI